MILSVKLINAGSCIAPHYLAIQMQAACYLAYVGAPTGMLLHMPHILPVSGQYLTMKKEINPADIGKRRIL